MFESRWSMYIEAMAWLQIERNNVGLLLPATKSGTHLKFWRRIRNSKHLDDFLGRLLFEYDRRLLLLDHIFDFLFSVFNSLLCKPFSLTIWTSYFCPNFYFWTYFLYFNFFLFSDLIFCSHLCRLLVSHLSQLLISQLCPVSVFKTTILLSHFKIQLMRFYQVWALESSL